MTAICTAQFIHSARPTPQAGQLYRHFKGKGAIYRIKGVTSAPPTDGKRAQRLTRRVLKGNAPICVARWERDINVQVPVYEFEGKLWAIASDAVILSAHVIYGPADTRDPKLYARDLQSFTETLPPDLARAAGLPVGALRYTPLLGGRVV